MSIVNNKGKDMPQQILGTTVQKTDDAVGIFRNDQEKALVCGCCKITIEVKSLSG